MLSNIQSVIQEELFKINAYIARCLAREEPTIQQLIQYLLSHPGKQLRPQLVFLVAGMLGKNITEKTRRGAALVSLLHSASLIHDDVVDESTYRRYTATFNAVFGNHLAVLAGDYVLANMLRIAAENQDYDYISMLTTTAQAMSEGEIMQLRQAHEIMLSEAVYLEIIQKKTASFFGASCAIGAMSVGASQEQIEKTYTIGEQLGIAFQLSDDLSDYGTLSDPGKPIFMDLKAQKLTLPLVYTLQQAPASEAKYILALIKNQNPKAEALQVVLRFIKKLGGIDYTLQRLSFYQQKALRLVNDFAKPSVYTDALIALIQQSISQNYMFHKTGIL